jgi:hypothetical protein
MAFGIRGLLQLARTFIGQNMRMMHWGQVTFTGTNATDTLKVNMRVVEAVIITHGGLPATDEEVYWADTPNTNGMFVVPATGVITIGRTGAAKTSGLPVCVLVIGF